MKIVYILFFLSFSILSYAQYGKLFSADKEISNSLIYGIHQDRNGVIWIATEDGLNRYDGAKFTIYKHNKDDSLSLQHNYVRLFFEDSKGHFIAGFFNGLQLYDYAKDEFHEVPMLFSDGVPFRAHVVSILERKNGELLIGTSGQGMYKLNFENGTAVANQMNAIIPSRFVLYMYEDRDENLWVSTEDKGLYRLSKDNKLKSFFKYDDIVLNNISSICEDDEGTILVGSLTNGLFRHDKVTDKFVPVVYAENQNLPIKTLYRNNPNEIYIGTDGNGVKVYLVNERRIADVLFNVTGFDFEKSKIHAIIKDKSDNLWLGIFQKGVMFIPARINKFGYIGYKSVRNNTIGSNYIMSLTKDRDDLLWVGTDNDGIYAVSPDGKQYAHFEHNNKRNNSVPNTIMSMYEDSEENFWIGSYLNGMAKFNKKTGSCEYITDFFDENENTIQRVFAFAEDSEKNLWIGTMGAGLFSMDIRTGKITNQNKIKATDSKDEDNILYNYWIHCLLFAENKLYIGTYDGILCLDLKTKNYVSTFGTLRLLEGMPVYCLYKEENGGDLWVGTSSGLVCIKEGNHEVLFYTADEGLPSDVICAIKGDDDGDLWISTHYGISRFDKDSSTFVNYYANDGLQGNEFSKGAAVVDKNGCMFFGGISGITYFKPQEIKYVEKKLNIHITDFYIYDQPVKKGLKSGHYEIVDTSVIDAGEFRLSHKDNSFSVEFSAMEFNNPERITYMYCVNNENWVTLHPGTNRVSFSNLSPGKYKFKVKAKDYNSYSDEKNISVIIFPPWYLTIWAKLAYSVIAILILYLIFLYIRQRYRSRQKMLEHQHAKEINEAKLQFFINIAHEIRTPMSLIISPLKRLMAVDHDPERGKKYNMIYRNAERILNLINQLMDVRKIDKGIMVLKFQKIEIISFIRNLYSYFEYQAKTKEIEFGFHTKSEQQFLWIDPKNFDKIIMNVISNAFKYVPEKGKVDIYLDTVEEINERNETKGYFEIVISDNGIGIKEGEQEHIFERFYQIQNSHNSSNIGTGVGLHLTRSLVELHHGKIRAENNNEGKGSCFIIHIPLGDEHLKPGEIENNPELMQKEIYDTGKVVEVVETEENIKSKTKRRVMVVEDDDEIRKYICKELSHDYHTVEYVNGKEALAAILKKAPDLVISDVMMPEMDGITLCRKIKQNVNINHIPVILVTAKSKEEDNLEGLSIGADAYIVKPFNMEILKKTVGNMIHNRDLLRNTFKGAQQQEDKMQKIEIKSADEKLMERVMKVINENISNPDLSVEMIADKVGLSRVHLHRKLKELTNQTTRDFIRNIRLKQAADLFVSKNLSISEVAEATGFNNLGYFSKVFKELYGVSPSSYIEGHRNQ